MTTPISRRPTDIGSALGLLAALVAAMAAVTYSTVGAVLGLVGLVTFAAGIVLPRPGLVSLGAFSLFVGVIVSGVFQAPAALVVVGVMGAVLAWDLTHNAASHGRQVGAKANTARAEIVHAGGSILAGGVSGGFALGVYLVVTGGYSTTAVALLALASVLLVLAIR